MTLSRAIGRGLKYPALFLAVMAALCMVSIVGIIVVSVLMRKFFNMPLFFGEEVVGMLMSVSLFLALPMVTLMGTHVRVSILSAYLKKRSHILYVVITRLAALVGIVCCGWLVLEAVPWVEFAIKHNLKTETSRILLYPSMAVLPVSVALTGIIFVARLLGWTGDNEENGPEIPAGTGD